MPKEEPKAESKQEGGEEKPASLPASAEIKKEEGAAVSTKANEGGAKEEEDISFAQLQNMPPVEAMDAEEVSCLECIVHTDLKIELKQRNCCRYIGLASYRTASS